MNSNDGKCCTQLSPLESFSRIFDPYAVVLECLLYPSCLPACLSHCYICLATGIWSNLCCRRQISPDFSGSLFVTSDLKIPLKITSEQKCLWRELISGSSAVIFRLQATVLPVSRMWHITKMYLKSYQNVFENIVYMIECWRSVILSLWSATWELFTSIILTT